MLHGLWMRTRLYTPADPEFVIIHGDAQGADRLAAAWGQWHLGGEHVKPFPAKWDKHLNRAGYIRNQQMLDEGKPDLVVAFRCDGESKGTDMMIDLARKAGVPTYVVTGGER